METAPSKSMLPTQGGYNKTGSTMVYAQLVYNLSVVLLPLSYHAEYLTSVVVRLC